MSIEERRKHNRVKGDIAIAINTAESNFISEASTISVAGVSCKVSQDIPLLSNVMMTLLLPSGTAKSKKIPQKLNCEGVIVRSEPIKEEPGSFEVAVFFADIGKQERKSLENYVIHVESKDV